MIDTITESDMFLPYNDLPRRPLRSDVIEINDPEGLSWFGTKWRLRADAEMQPTGEWRCPCEVHRIINQQGTPAGHPRPGVLETVPAPPAPAPTPPTGESSAFILTNLGAVPILKGQPVASVNPGPGVVLANGSAQATLAVGFAAEDIAPATAGAVLSEGQLNLTDWTAIIGGANLTPGLPYFLDFTDGLLVASAPDAGPGFVHRVGKAVTSTRLDIEIAQPVQLQ